MMEMISIQTEKKFSNSNSQTAHEVTQFMRNFLEAAHEGNADESATYFSDEMGSFDFPLNAQWDHETVAVDEHLATFKCSLSSALTPAQQVTCVLDKSEGFWQIIHCELKSEGPNH